nr:DUF2975 domain-containing protein [Eubacterium sp.]
MKENAIQKINKMGKAGAILALITKIFLGIGLGGCLIGLIVTAVLPAEMVQVKMAGTADIIVDLSNFGEDIFENSEVTKEEIVDNVKSSSNINYAGNEMYVSDVQTEGSKMQLQAGGELTTFNLRSCTWALVGAILNLVLLFVSTVFVSRLAKAFRDCDSPFEDIVIRRMKQFAYSLIPWAVVSSVVGYFESKIWMSGSSSVNFSVDITMVIIVLVILALAYIFQYGAVLQQESDETL